MEALGRVAIRVAAVLYLVGLFFDGVGYDPPLRGLPGPLRYALEVAALFPDAAKSVSEYRAEAWSCSERRWHELDTRPYFPLHADDKESRFQRALQFYHDEPVLKRELAGYLADSHNRADARRADDGIPRTARVGGVRLLILRSPVPRPGDALTPYTMVPLAALDRETIRSVFYEPTDLELEAGCAASADPGGRTR